MGSESGIGWHFAIELARHHKITAIISDTRKPFIEQSLKGSSIENLEIIYYGLPSWVKRFYKPATASEHIYYFLWQIGLYYFSRKIIRERNINLIHHITLGVFRIPSFMWMHGKPFVFGPVGGGEESAVPLRKSLPAKFRRIEWLRSRINKFSRFTPGLNSCLKNSDLILLRTSDNLRHIPAKFHHKCKVLLGVGIEHIHEIQEKPADQKFSILYTGRLIYWKGVHLAIKAFASIQHRHAELDFTIVGSGSESDWLKDIAKQEGVYEKINWIPRVQQQVLFQMYRDYDVFLFPSLHDSGGEVVLEALSYGLPVICLDSGGPKEMVDSSCGAVIRTDYGGEHEVVTEIAVTLLRMLDNPDMLQQMRKNAILKAQTQTWDKVKERAYEMIADDLYDLA